MKMPVVFGTVGVFEKERRGKRTGVLKRVSVYAKMDRGLEDLAEHSGPITKKRVKMADQGQMGEREFRVFSLGWPLREGGGGKTNVNEY